MNRIYLFLFALLASLGITASAADAVTSYTVKLPGQYNNYNWNNTTKPNSNGIAKFTNQKIYQSNNVQRFQLQVNHDNQNFDFSIKGSGDNRPVPQNVWVECERSSQGMVVKDAVANQGYDVYFNVKTNKLLIVKTGTSVDGIGDAGSGDYEQGEDVSGNGYSDIWIWVNGFGNVKMLGYGDNDNERSHYFKASFKMADENEHFNIYKPEATLRWGNTTVSPNTKDAKILVKETNFENAYFSGFKKDQWYTIKVFLADNGNATVIEVVPEGEFYFYGDMNLWSIINETDVSLDESHLNPVQVYERGASRTEENNKAAAVFNGEENIPPYKTIAELENDWKFLYLTSSNSQYIKGPVKGGDNWYYLDFKGKEDFEKNVDLICGQFKITTGTWGGTNWGISSVTDDKVNATYFSTNLVKAGGSTATSVVNGGGQNILLENNYVSSDANGFGPVLYFNPNTNQVFIYGEGHNYYVYYTVIGADSFVAPTSQTLIDHSQENYYVNIPGFNGDNKYPSDYNSGNYNVGNKYTWEEVSGLKYGNLTGLTAYRRRIPPSASHRFSVQNTVTVTDYKGTFNARPLSCDDVWFIRAAKDVNLHFRYNSEANTQNLDWVCYNAFFKEYKNNIFTGYNYLFGDFVDFKSDRPSIHNGEWGFMKLERIDANATEHAGELWWSSPASLPIDFQSAAWAMFADSRGGTYPADREKSSEDELLRVEIKGSDIWFEVQGDEESDLSLLYSHLNGTYSLKGNAAKDVETNGSAVIQINAEFFLPEGQKDVSYFTSGDLMTHTGLVEYSFAIYKDNNLVTGTLENGKVVYQQEPFFNWVVKGNDPSQGSNASVNYSEGYYNIIVKARYRNKIYSTEDTYVIYE